MKISYFLLLILSLGSSQINPGKYQHLVLTWTLVHLLNPWPEMGTLGYRTGEKTSLGSKEWSAGEHSYGQHPSANWHQGHQLVSGIREGAWPEWRGSNQDFPISSTPFFHSPLGNILCTNHFFLTPGMHSTPRGQMSIRRQASTS